MNRQEQKIEAIERMKMLKLHENPIREFEQQDKLNLSGNGGMLLFVNTLNFVLFKTIFC